MNRVQISADFATAKAQQIEMESQCKAASVALDQFPKSGPMGLTPDSVKFSDEYRAAKAAYQAALYRLQVFNACYVKRFKAELKAERRNRHA